MFKEYQKEKDSKVLSKDMDNTEDQWGMVLCIIEDQVQWDQHLHQVEYLKVKNYQDTWGVQKITIQNLEIIKVDMDKNVLLVKGSVPGPKGAILKIKSSVKSCK